MLLQPEEAVVLLWLNPSSYALFPPQRKWGTVNVSALMFQPCSFENITPKFGFLLVLLQKHQDSSTFIQGVMPFLLVLCCHSL